MTIKYQRAPHLMFSHELQRAPTGAMTRVATEQGVIAHIKKERTGNGYPRYAIHQKGRVIARCSGISQCIDLLTREEAV